MRIQTVLNAYILEIRMKLKKKKELPQKPHGN